MLIVYILLAAYLVCLYLAYRGATAWDDYVDDNDIIDGHDTK